MPTESRERLKKSLYKFYEQATSTAAGAAATKHQNSNGIENGIRPPRSRPLKSSRSAAKLYDTAPYAATDVLDSNPAGSTKSSRVSSSSRSATRSPYTSPYSAAADYLDIISNFLPRIRTSRSGKSSAYSSPSDSSPNQEELLRREQDIFLIREELMKHSIGLPNSEQLRAARMATLDPFLVNSTSSWVNSLREPPPGRRDTASRKQARQKEIMSENRRSSTSEEDKPTGRNVDSMPASRTQKYKSLTASQSRDFPTKPANPDRQPVEETKNGDIPAVQKNSFRRSNSTTKIVDLTKPSNGHRNPSPAQSRQRIPSDSLTGSAAIIMPSGAKRRINLDSTEVFLKPEVARSSSARFARTRAGSSDGLNVDLKLNGAGPNNFKPRSLREEMRDEKPADATRTHKRHASSGENLKREDERPAYTEKTHRRHSSTGGNLKREHDIARIFAGRGLSQSLRHEGESDSVPGSRRRSISRNKDNLKREDEEKKGPAHTPRTNGKLVSDSGNLKREDDSAADFRGRSLRHEGEFQFPTASRRRSSSRNKDNLKLEDEEKKGPAYTPRTNRRLVSDEGNLKREDDSAADFPGRSLRHEREFENATGSRRRSSSRKKDNLKIEDEDEQKKGSADTQMTSRRLVSDGRNLKREEDSGADFPGRSLRHEGEFDFATGSRRRSSNRNNDNLKIEDEDEQKKGSADTPRTNGRLVSDGGNLKREDDSAADFPGRSLRHEGEFEFATGSRRRSSNRNNDNLKIEDEDEQKKGSADTPRTNRRLVSDGGNLKREDDSAADFPGRSLRHEGEFEFATGSRRRSSSGNNDKLKLEDGDEEKKGSADTPRTNRRLVSDGGNLKHQEDSAADFPGSSLRHEGEFDFATGSRRRSSSGNNDNLKIEDEDEEKKGSADTPRTNRRLVSDGGNLKHQEDSAADFPGRSLRHEGEFEFATGSRRRTSSGNNDNLKIEDEDEEKKGSADTPRTNRRLVSDGGNLKHQEDSAADFPGRSLRHEGEFEFATGSRRRTSSGNNDNLKIEDEDEEKKGSADTPRTNRRLVSDGGNLKHQEDSAADFPGRSLRHEGEFEFATGSRRRTSSGNNDNLKIEDEDEEKKGSADTPRTNRRLVSDGGNLKHQEDSAADFPGRSLRHEGEFEFATGSRRRSSSGNNDNLKIEDEDEEKKGSADTPRTNRRLVSDEGDLKRKEDSAADFPGRRLRHDGEFEFATFSRRRSGSGNKDNLKIEDEDEEKQGSADTPRTNRRLFSDGRNLKREDDSAADFPGRSLGHEGEFEFATGSRRRSSNRNNDNLKDEDEQKKGSADTPRTNRRLVSDGGNLKRKEDPAADFPGRSLRHGGEFDFSTGSRRRSSSRNQDNLKIEDENEEKKGSGRTNRRLVSDGGNLKRKDDLAADFPGRSLRHEGEFEFATGSRRRSSSRNKNFQEENVSNSAAGSRGTPNRTWKPDAFKSSFSAFPKHRASRDNGGMPLTKVAAASYNGGWLPYGGMVPFPDDIAGLNKFLDGCRKEVEAGVLGRYLTVVLGKENSDLDSMVSTIAYAYFLHCKINQVSQYILPVINMRQEDFLQKNEAAWLFKVSGVDTSNFIFVDQISLPYYNKFGSLSLVLVDHSKLAPHLEEDLQDTVVTIIDHNLPESVYPSVLNLEIEEVGSCCTIIAEKYVAEAPEQLAGRGISRLLLGPILLDTTNLDATFDGCTTRDECMAALLINGAGCYSRQGFFRYLRNLRFDISHLSTKDALKKEFVEWKLGNGKGRTIYAAMSSLGVPLFAILSRKEVITDLIDFGRTRELDFHLIVTGYFDNFDRYRREILVVLEDNELARDVSTCFSERNDVLKLSSLRIEGLPQQMLVYKQRKVTASRKVIRKILSVHFAR